jgi:hypothetical protein
MQRGAERECWWQRLRALRLLPGLLQGGTATSAQRAQHAHSGRAAAAAAASPQRRRRPPSERTNPRAVNAPACGVWKRVHRKAQPARNQPYLAGTVQPALAAAAYAIARTAGAAGAESSAAAVQGLISGTTQQAGLWAQVRAAAAGMLPPGLWRVAEAGEEAQ